MTRGDRTRSVAAVYDRRPVSSGGRRLPLQFAFTLVELLVVIGIVALIAGGFGLALGDSGGPSLATAQTSVLTMAGAARAQAAVQQTKVRLYVYGTRPPVGDAEKFLRLLQLFREEPADSGNYLPVGSAVVLPRGVYVVPNSTTGLVAAGVVWPTNPTPVSVFATPQPAALRPNQPAGTPFGGGAAGYYIEFDANGASMPANAKVVVATAALANNLPQFNKPAAVRGVLVRPSGAIVAINDLNGF